MFKKKKKTNDLIVEHILKLMNENEKKNKKRNCDFKKMLKLLMQFIFSFVILLVLTVELIRYFDGSISFLSFFVQLCIAIASNCCSISCTMMFLDEKKNDEHFMNKKMCCIIFSLLIYLMLYFYVRDGFDKFNNKDLIGLIVLTGISLLILVVIIIIIGKDFFDIQKDNKNFLDSKNDSLNSNQKKEVKNAHTPSNEKVGDEMYNFEGDENEN